MTVDPMSVSIEPPWGSPLNTLHDVMHVHAALWRYCHRTGPDGREARRTVNDWFNQRLDALLLNVSLESDIEYNGQYWQAFVSNVRKLVLCCYGVTCNGTHVRWRMVCRAFCMRCLPSLQIELNMLEGPLRSVIDQHYQARLPYLHLQQNKRRLYTAMMSTQLPTDIWRNIAPFVERSFH
jgi:hypothetical protein